LLFCFEDWVCRVFVFTICHKESLVLDLGLVEAFLCFFVKVKIWLVCLFVLFCFFFLGAVSDDLVNALEPTFAQALNSSRHGFHSQQG
jgi:fucose permease